MQKVQVFDIPFAGDLCCQLHSKTLYSASSSALTFVLRRAAECCNLSPTGAF